MCTEQKHVPAELASRTLRRKGESLTFNIGAQNWAVLRRPLDDYQKTIALGCDEEDPGKFVFDLLFAIVTLHYQGFVYAYVPASDGKEAKYVYHTNMVEFGIKDKFAKMFDAATRVLIQKNPDVNDFVGAYLSWYSSHVAANEPMPYPEQLWQDMLSVSTGMFHEFSDYEINYNGSQPAMSGTETDVVRTYLTQNEFDVFGNLIEESHE